MDSRSFLHLKSALMAAEPTHYVIDLARKAGGGSVTATVQKFILENCIPAFEQRGTVRNHMYIKNVLQQVIAAAESTCEVEEGLYEQFAFYLTAKMDDKLQTEGNKIYKHVSFLSPLGSKSWGSDDLIFPLLCSINLLEGDTGCALWPSSLFLSEFILSYRDMFSNKFCFEVGSGVGLVGLALEHAGASKVILTDGDLSSLENLKYNMELNRVSPSSVTSERGFKQIECKHLTWEAASESEVNDYFPDVILGADVIYDPLCIPHLIRLVSILLNPARRCPAKSGNDCISAQLKQDLPEDKAKDAPVAFIATVIRNPQTFSYFLELAPQSGLSVLDITETMRPDDLLPYMLSYDRASVHLLRVSYSCT